MNPATEYPLIGIVGPTGSGKSALAACLARRLGGEIVNCDAMQVYRGLDVGTAKVSPEIRAEIPHHLLDVVEVSQRFSAGQFQDLARQALEGIRARRNWPILAGGTGFYLRTVLYGIFEAPGRDEALRDRLNRIRERRGPEVLHRILGRRDPEAARRIAPRDFQRICRALEVAHATGRPFTEHFGTSERPLTGFMPRMYCLNVPRPELHDRIARRVADMLAGGLVDEVRGLLARGVAPDAKGLEAIGYRQVMEHLAGRLTWLEMARRIEVDTRRYAKRQMTWFRKERGLVAVAGTGDDPAVHARVFEDIAAAFGAHPLWETVRARMNQ
ncbi:MAG: tRNA (adenosine(37)-N6)-dimethylallyltransferase MiaA [Acidobacteria bacterium]|nr:tRNA (adenosine(37)-N6)-dimethylallyltransferase MiaA [Acidobacteriota bacterium]